MTLRCPTCGSKDLWQPHKDTSFDLLLRKHGYERFDCRNCWKRSIFRIQRQAPKRETPRRETEATPPVPEGKATEPIAATRAPESTVIGAAVLISGIVSSSEGVTVRGVLEGTLDMDGCQLVIEPGGNVTADVNAGSITVCREGNLTGQVRTPSFVLEDGAYFKGNIELTAR
jgi:cytoskeletal protein CcmA (bactofilin family)/predicted RNA-binding Zn-ribbon protein involved in translation (DUF1610 family)